jgi:hypothetical protein
MRKPPHLLISNQRNLLVVSTVILFAISHSIMAGSSDSARTTHHLSLISRFSQYKDANNYGLNFSGPGVIGRYTLLKINRRSYFSYQGELGTDLIMNKGAGFALVFNPIEVSYGYHANKKSSLPFDIGVMLSTRYNWQFYPSTTSAYMHWLTIIQIGPKVTFYHQYGSNKLTIALSNSFFGWVSRSQPPVEVYFYELGFSDFVQNAHRDLEAGSFDSFNHSHLEITLYRPKKSAIGYEFDYYGYFKSPSISVIYHSISLTWML